MKLLHLDRLPLLFTIDRNCGTHETPETASGGQTGLACAIQMTHFFPFFRSLPGHGGMSPDIVQTGEG